MLLAPVIAFNREVAGAKYARLARDLGIAPADAWEEAAVERLHSFAADLAWRVGLPRRLAEIGLREDDLEYVATEAMSSGSTRANPRPVTPADALAVARTAL
jgi:alcohol dehydrogenase class IV